MLRRGGGKATAYGERQLAGRGGGKAAAYGERQTEGENQRGRRNERNVNNKPKRKLMALQRKL